MLVKGTVCVEAGKWASSCLSPQTDRKSVGSDITSLVMPEARALFGGSDNQLGEENLICKWGN